MKKFYSVLTPRGVSFTMPIHIENWSKCEQTLTASSVVLKAETTEG